MVAHERSRPTRYCAFRQPVRSREGYWSLAGGCQQVGSRFRSRQPPIGYRHSKGYQWSGHQGTTLPRHLRRRQQSRRSTGGRVTSEAPSLRTLLLIGQLRDGISGGGRYTQEEPRPGVRFGVFSSFGAWVASVSTFVDGHSVPVSRRKGNEIHPAKLVGTCKETC